MKKFFLLFLLFLGFGLFLLNVLKEKVKQDLAQPVNYTAITKAPAPNIKEPNDIASAAEGKKSLFVPYWTLSGEALPAGEYDQFFYFGILPGTDGIIADDPGNSRLNDFLSVIPENKEKFLVVRMIESENNFAVLKDKAIQRNIIQHTITLAKKNNFEGIILDLEIAAIPFDSLILQINSFVSLFYSEVKKSDLLFFLTLYGDTFYRLRPYDMKMLSQNADTFMIMAYDFHKANGNPGPNFPLRGQEKYGYDMTKAVDDFLAYIPAENLVVIFGLFGYDWTVNEKGEAISQGKPLSYQEIRKRFLETCSFKNCSVKRDSVSSETEIRYSDVEDKSHVVWFEDMDSVSAKQKFLKEKGINSFSFWAHSYF